MANLQAAAVPAGRSRVAVARRMAVTAAPACAQSLWPGRMRLMGCVSGAGADAEGREARKVNKQIEEQLAKDKQVRRRLQISGLPACCLVY